MDVVLAVGSYCAAESKALVFNWSDGNYVVGGKLWQAKSDRKSTDIASATTHYEVSKGLDKDTLY
jgi:hypothetical protein